MVVVGGIYHGGGCARVFYVHRSPPPSDPTLLHTRPSVLVFGSGDDDHEYVASLGCTISRVESADFLLARGPFAVLDDPVAGEAEVGPWGVRPMLDGYLDLGVQ